MSDYVVVRSAFIATRQETVDYYAARIAGVRLVRCYGRDVQILFEHDGTHLFSESVDDESSVPKDERIVRRVPGGRIEVRRFSLKRAQLLDDVTVAIAKYTVSIPGTGPQGREKRMLHGPCLPSGEYLRVVLRPGPRDMWTCVSAYPVSRDMWLAANRAKRAKFPPE
jgi:hypothetical protein